uniref:Uncharacterized protein n=1 Tax=Myotis myotis TaxID=51298 RepID=A0A7J7WHJ8_MYOMY|nr:hypothetical protein mMyoMyo1_012065 [Myotis myotis]
MGQVGSVPATMGLGGFPVTWLFQDRAMVSINAKLCQLSLGSTWKVVDLKREVQFSPGEKDRERRSRCPEPGSRRQLCTLLRREAQGQTDGTSLLSSSHACLHPTEGPTEYLILPGTIYWWGQGP